jgi:hypothetical protein
LSASLQAAIGQTPATANSGACGDPVCANQFWSGTGKTWQQSCAATIGVIVVQFRPKWPMARELNAHWHPALVPTGARRNRASKRL